MSSHAFDRLDSARANLESGRPDRALRALAGRFPAFVRGDAYFLQGEACRAIGYFRRAIASYEKALREIGSSDSDLAAQAWLGLTRCHRSLGEVDLARSALRSAERLDSALRRLRAEEIALERALVLRAAGRYQDALRRLATLLRSCRRDRDLAAVGFILWAMGGARRFSGDLARSHRDFRESLDAFRKASDREGTVYALFGLGGIARIRGRFEEARQSYASAKRLLKNSPDLFGRAYAHCGLANVLRQIGHWDEAERNYLASYELYVACDDQVDLAYVDWGLGQVNLKRGRLIPALRRFRAARGAFSRAKEARGEALSLQSMAHVLHALGRTSTAEATFDAAVACSRRAGLHAHLEIFT